MTARPPLRLALDDEFAALLALYTRTGETTLVALRKALRLRAGADGHLLPDGRIKRNAGRRAS